MLSLHSNKLNPNFYSGKHKIFRSACLHTRGESQYMPNKDKGSIGRQRL